jgi:hypothetical protein
LSIIVTNGVPKVDMPKMSGIEIKFLAPHYAHSVAGGPYTVVDTDGDGKGFVSFDGSYSHTHGVGAILVNYTWKEGSAILSQTPKPDLNLPVGKHSITLTVKDNGNSESTDLATVTVNPFGYPAVMTISPSNGTVAGGQVVTITGSGFNFTAVQTKVKFGLTELTGTALQFIDPFTIKLATPVAVVGTPVSVSVETPLAKSNAVTYTYVASSPIDFITGVLGTMDSPTSVRFGPDGKLYVGTLRGSLAKLTLDDSYTQVVSSTIAVVAEFRAILGIAFDPMQTSGNPDVYITSSQFYHGGSNSSSGTGINGNVKRVSGANLDVIVNIVTGLPVSDSDHGTYNILDESSKLSHQNCFAHKLLSSLRC